MKKLEINQDNMETIKRLVMYADDDMAFFRELKTAIFNFTYSYNVGIDAEKEIKKHLFEIGQYFEDKF